MYLALKKKKSNLLSKMKRINTSHGEQWKNTTAAAETITVPSWMSLYYSTLVNGEEMKRGKI